LLDELQSRQLGHLVVDDQQLGRSGGEVRESVGGLREAVDGVAFRLQHLDAHANNGRLVVDDDDGHARLRRSSARSLYSTESTSASQEASMMLSATPTVPQVSLASPEVISTRVFAAVPFDSSRIRTL